MKVILNQDDAGLGHKDQVVEVAEGYALNFLLPQGIAREASKKNLEELEAKKAQEEAKRQEIEAQLEESLSTIKGVTLELARKANEKGHLYAAVSPEEIATEIKNKHGVEVTEQYIEPKDPVKEVGTYQMQITVGDKKAEFQLNITAEQTEPKE